MISEIIMPDLGAAGSDVSLDEWLVKPGDFVKAGTPLFIVTTDKANEDYLYQLFLQGLVPGTLHQYQGQEAVAVGVCTVLRRDDVIFSTHRPVGHLLAKGSSPQGIAAEIWGKATGCAGHAAALRLDTGAVLCAFG